MRASILQRGSIKVVPLVLGARRFYWPAWTFGLKFEASRLFSQES